MNGTEFTETKYTNVLSPFSPILLIICCCHSTSFSVLLLSNILCSRSGLTYITVFWLSLHIAKNEVNALPSVRSIVHTKFASILILYIKIANLCQLIFHLFAFLCFFFEFRHFLLIEDNVTLLAKIMIALAICCTNKLNWGYFHTTGQLILHHLFLDFLFIIGRYWCM